MKKILVLLSLLFVFASCTVKAPESDPNIDITKVDWKKTFMLFWATWCPHCKAELPVLDKFYRDYKDQVNMQVFVIDGKKFTWDYIIPQDISKSTTYEWITWEKCDYVPSYVVYDKDKNIIAKECWAKKTYEELQTLLINNETSTWTLNTNQTWATMKNEYQLAPLKNDDVVAVLTTTNWTIKIKLFTEDAPKTTLNFIWLAKKWYYDWIIFHRVIKDFMIQWWDPAGTWTWWQSLYWSEFEDEFSDKLSNIKWAVSMANAWPDTNWSQFFINQKDNNFLDFKHSVFWQVVEWLDNVDKIASVKTDSNDKPVKEVKIIKAEIKVYKDWTLNDYKVNVEDEIKKLEAEKQAKLEADKNRVVKIWDIIKVNYIWKTTSDWKEFDNSYTRGEPIEFEVWSWTMIKWFDEWVRWMKIGEKKTLKIKAVDAYWEYSDKNIQEIPKTQLQDFVNNGIELKVWNKLPTPYWEFEIKEVSADSVKVDLNFPLAWKDLTFDVEIVGFVN